MVISGLIFNLLFFPGVIFHEFSHFLMCYLLGVRVVGVKWWGLKHAYVVHEKTDKVYKTVLLTIAPFLISNAIALELMILVVGINTNPFNSQASLFFFWLAASLAFHSFPSMQDAKNSMKCMSDHFRQNFAKHWKGPQKAVLKALGYTLLLVFVYVPISAILGMMVVLNYFLPAILAWVWVVYTIGLSIA